MHTRIIIAVGTPPAVARTEPDHADLRRISHVDHPSDGCQPPRCGRPLGGPSDQKSDFYSNLLRQDGRVGPAEAPNEIGLHRT